MAKQEVDVFIANCETRQLREAGAGRVAVSD